MTEEELDAAVDVIAAVDAGVLQSLNQRINREAHQKNEVGTTRDPPRPTSMNAFKMVRFRTRLVVVTQF